MRIPVFAQADGVGEPRETMTLVAELTAHENDNTEQIVEGRKTMYIIDQGYIGVHDLSRMAARGRYTLTRQKMR